MINNNIKLYIILLLIFYIYFILLVYKFFCCNNKKENFIGFLEMISSKNNFDNISNDNNNISNDNNNISNDNIPFDNNPKEIKKNNNKIKKYIYISNVYNDKSIIKYNFYNKDDDLYLKTMIYDDINLNKILIKDNLNNIIGKDINKKHNNIIINFNLYNSNIIIEYYNKFKSIKIYLENDDKIFHINENNKNYKINLFTLNIGYINYDQNNNLYKSKFLTNKKNQSLDHF
jgi:hypothetical protein